VAVKTGFDCESTHRVEMHGFEGCKMEGLIEADVCSATDEETNEETS
jgi:hypothetical protein